MRATHADELLEVAPHPLGRELDVALGRQRVDDQLPRAVLLADPVGDRHLDVVEADLVEPLAVDAPGSARS